MNAPRSGCPINLTLEALGDRWSLIVIRDLTFGNRRHFREVLTRSEERIASNFLADRLTRLEKAGLVCRRDDRCHKQKIIAGAQGVGLFQVAVGLRRPPSGLGPPLESPGFGCVLDAEPQAIRVANRRRYGRSCRR